MDADGQQVEEALAEIDLLALAIVTGTLRTSSKRP